MLPTLILCALLLIPCAAATNASPPAPLPPVPTSEQLAWQELEYGLFCHFGINTFHDAEWSDGTKEAVSFNPTGFDARQWAATAKACGMNYLVVTAKHHDGFCVYPTAFTDYSVQSSPWREGRGDVLREVSEACRESGLVFGFYLSPWDRHEPTYRDSAAYDEHFKKQLRELLTQYGPVGEVWFDGAGSEGHEYDWTGYYELIRAVQSKALIAICGPDIRWVGNEDGLAPETLWNVQQRSGDILASASGQTHQAVSSMESVWWPSECDVPIRKGQWFYHTDGEAQLRSIPELLEIYYRSVGRGATLLLNVSPDRRGQLPEADTARLRELWSVVSETFRTNLALNKPSRAGNVRGADTAFGADKAVDDDPTTYWASDDAADPPQWIEIDLGAPTTFNRSRVEEFLALGQRVQEYVLEAWDGAAWKAVVRGTTIGHKRLDRFPEVTASKVRLTIEKALACPCIRSFGLYHATTE